MFGKAKNTLRIGTIGGEDTYLTGDTYTVVLSKADLETARATASDGDVYYLDNGVHSEFFEFFGTRFGYAINEFIPLEFAKRITGIATVSGGAHKAIIDWGAGDRIATLSTRGWTMGGHSDGTNGIRTSSSSLGPRAVRHTLDQTGELNIYAIARLYAVAVNASSGRIPCGVFYNSASRMFRTPMMCNGNLNQACFTGSTSTLLSEGYMRWTNNEPLHYAYESNSEASLRTVEAGAGDENAVILNKTPFTNNTYPNGIGMYHNTQASNTIEINKLIYFTMA